MANLEDGWKYDLAMTFKNGKCTGIYAADERKRQLIDVTDEVRELLGLPPRPLKASQDDTK